MAIILLVIGLGWHAVWNGITEGAATLKDAIVKVINYYSGSQSGESPNSSNHSYPTNSHARGMNKV
jgi:hypothetical protein